MLRIKLHWHSRESDPRICATARANPQRNALVSSLRGFPRIGMQLHVNRLSCQLLCTGVFNAAEEAELCSQSENYGRSTDPLQ